MTREHGGVHVAPPCSRTPELWCPPGHRPGWPPRRNRGRDRGAMRTPGASPASRCAAASGRWWRTPTSEGPGTLSTTRASRPAPSRAARTPTSDGPWPSSRVAPARAPRATGGQRRRHPMHPRPQDAGRRAAPWRQGAGQAVL